MPGQKLPRSFYQQDDVVSLSKQLIGKVLCTKLDGYPLTSGIIVETEAYCGRGDKACHAHAGRRTERTETMYMPGGVGYIYLCYGIHHLFNVVTNRKDRADAVLIRAVKPLDGKETMIRRRGARALTPSLTAGPGRLAQALGITTENDGVDLTGNSIWIEDRNIEVAGLASDQRIGVDYAGEDALRAWRFYPQNSDWVSRK